MKKLYMHTIMGFSGRDCVLIALCQCYGSKAGLFESNSTLEELINIHIT